MKTPRFSPRVVFWALAAFTLLVSHDAVWLVQLGPGEHLASALRTEEHGYWAVASVAILGVVALAALATVTRAIGLARRARQLDAAVPGVRGRSVLGHAAVAWIRLLAVVGIGFAIQENVEHFLAHGHVLGFGAITGPEYPLAVPVLAAVTAVAALLGAFVRSVEAELVAGIAAALRGLRPRPSRTTRHVPGQVHLRRLPAMAGSDAERAPPILLVGT
jgi:hypothetical protein